MDAFASHLLKTQEKKYSTNDFKQLAIVWSLDQFIHLLGKEYISASDRKALTSALDAETSQTKPIISTLNVQGQITTVSNQNSSPSEKRHGYS